MSALTQLTAAELAEKLQAREVSAEEATKAHLDRIDEVNDQVGVFLVTNDEALEAARAIDARRAGGESLHELAGVPVAVKDVLVTTEMPTTASSAILKGYRSPFDATVVTKAREAGLVLLGKTNMDEFAMGSTTETSAYGNTHNPWNLDRVPGGSGGGSAAAVASFMAPLAFGSDTGGSIRQPASLTGTVGMKPTYGGVSRYGSIALGSSLDQVGPCARTVLDTALMHDVIVGFDSHESTSAKREWPSMAAAAREGATGESLKGLRIGVVSQFATDAVEPDVAQHFDAMIAEAKQQGATIVEIDAEALTYGAAVYMLLMSAEASSNLAKFDSVRFGQRVVPEGAANVEDVMSASRGAGFGYEVKRRLLLGTYALSAGNFDRLFIGAQRVRAQITEALVSAFANVDVIVTPTSATTAQRFANEQVNPDAGLLTDSMLTAANLSGMPALSVPVGVAQDGLPVGLQVIAPTFEDARAYRVGAAFEHLVAARDGAPFWQSIPALSGKASA